jgi:hypothetical protein
MKKFKLLALVSVLSMGFIGTSKADDEGQRILFFKAGNGSNVDKLEVLCAAEVQTFKERAAQYLKSHSQPAAEVFGKLRFREYSDPFSGSYSSWYECSAFVTNTFVDFEWRETEEIRDPVIKGQPSVCEKLVQATYEARPDVMFARVDTNKKNEKRRCKVNFLKALN